MTGFVSGQICIRTDLYQDTSSDVSESGHKKCAFRRWRDPGYGGLKKGSVPDKKCGAESSDPNRHSQPRLPGSVVGETSMRQEPRADKITKVRSYELPSDEP